VVVSGSQKGVSIMRSTRLRRAQILASATVLLAFGAAYAGGSALAGARVVARPAAPHAAAPISENALAGITCEHLSSCWAVGYRGSNPSLGGALALRWSTHHHAWRRVPTPTLHQYSDSSFNAVSCTGRSNCLAVGAGGAAPPVLTVSALAERWNGHHWTRTPLPNPRRYPGDVLNGVSCPTHNDCIAVGSYTTDRSEGDTHVLAEIWNGTTWSAVTAPSPYDSSVFNGVSCVSTTSCVAVGSYVRSAVGYPLTEFWNGSVWSLVTPRDRVNPVSTELDGVSCAAAADCLAAGDYDDSASVVRSLAEHVSAPTTAALLLPKNPSHVHPDELWADSCATTSYCLAVGEEDTNSSGTHIKTLAERWNGSTWKILTTPHVHGSASVRFLAVGCVSASDCFAVGDNAGSPPSISALTERWNGHHWTVITS
jgi:hypothetical protein